LKQNNPAPAGGAAPIQLRCDASAAPCRP
jgi:hypothetical protein